MRGLQAALSGVSRVCGYSLAATLLSDSDAGAVSDSLVSSVVM